MESSGSRKWHWFWAFFALGIIVAMCIVGMFWRIPTWQSVPAGALLPKKPWLGPDQVVVRLFFLQCLNLVGGVIFLKGSRADVWPTAIFLLVVTVIAGFGALVAMAPSL